MIVLSIAAFALFASTCCLAQEGEVGIKFVGCFKDSRTDRALPVLYGNMRDKIDWTNMNETIRQCADAAANRHPPYMWFGVQFFGECWSGPQAEITYNKYGPSDNCVDGVGKGLANAIYRFYMKKAK